MKAMNRSVVVKRDQVCIGLFVTEVSIAPFSRKVKFGKPAKQVGQTVRVNEFSCCWRGVTPTLLFAVTQAVLLEVEALAKGGGVEVDDRYEFVAETFLKSAFCDPEFEVGSGVVKVTDEVEGSG
jgi:hypothetical protein